MKVLVCGGGPAGSVAALLLARQGCDVQLLERSPETAREGAALLLQPNGIAVLDGLDLRAAVESKAFANKVLRVCGASGRPLAETPVPDFGAGLDRTLALRRSHLASVFAEAVRAQPNVEMVHAAEVVEVDPDGTVTYRKEGADHRVVGDLIVGADGVRSIVRGDGTRFGGRCLPTGHRYSRTIVSAPPGVRAAEYWTHLGIFGSSPLADGTAYVYASASSPIVRKALEAGDAAAYRAAWSAALPPATRLLEQVDDLGDLLVHDVHEVRCDRYIAGRHVLLGDAAHAMEPTLGQGANSAMVDAAVLALEIAARSDLTAACAAYDVRRRPAVRRVQRDARRLAQLGHLKPAGRRMTRDVFLRTMSHQPSLAQRQFRATQQEDPAALARSLRA